MRCNPSDEIARLALAKAFNTTYQFQSAIPYVQEYIGSRPEDPEGYYVLGRAWMGLAKFDKARECFARAVQLDPDNFDFRYSLGFALSHLGKISDALGQMEAAEKLKPRDAQVHYQLYRLWLLEHEKARANRELREFYALNKAGEQRDLAAVMVAKGNQLLAAGNSLGAASAFKKALRLWPDDPEIHYDLSLAMSKLGRQDEASRELRKTIAIDPKFAPAHNRLGLILMADGKNSDAEREFKSASVIDPQFAEARNNLGVLLGREGKYAEAIECFRLAIEANPEFAEAYVNWALVMAQEGDYSSAKTKLFEALKLRPHFPDAERALQALSDRVAH